MVSAVPLVQFPQPGLGRIPLLDERGLQIAGEQRVGEPHAVASGLEHERVGRLLGQRPEVVAALGSVERFAGEHVAAQLAMGFEIGQCVHEQMLVFAYKDSKKMAKTGRPHPVKMPVSVPRPHRTAAAGPPWPCDCAAKAVRLRENGRAITAQTQCDYAVFAKRIQRRNRAITQALDADNMVFRQKPPRKILNFEF